jgi:hypothetical protein
MFSRFIDLFFYVYPFICFFYIVVTYMNIEFGIQILWLIILYAFSNVSALSAYSFYGKRHEVGVH